MENPIKAVLLVLMTILLFTVIAVMFIEYRNITHELYTVEVEYNAYVKDMDLKLALCKRALKEEKRKLKEERSNSLQGALR